MTKLILTRLGSTLVSLFLATIIVFMIMQASPSDPITLLLKTPGQRAIDKDVLEHKIEVLREESGLNDPPIVQYVNWLKRVARFDLGKSLLTGEPVRSAIARTLPNSVKLAIFSTLVQFSLAVFLGALSALKSDQLADQAIRFFCIFLKSIPFFAICIVTLTFFSSTLHLYAINTDTSFKRMLLPGILVGVTLTPNLIRLVRVSILDELSKTYVLDALSKGYGKWKIVSYALRNAMLPILTAISISFAANIGGMVVTESIFVWPGIGHYGLDAVMKLDYFAVQGYILIVVTFVLLINFFTDILYGLYNPRIRRGGFE